jgi:hypothetical protein
MSLDPTVLFNTIPLDEEVRLFVDDIRTPETAGLGFGWRLARSVSQALAIIRRNKVVELSLDFDMGNGHNTTAIMDYYQQRLELPRDGIKFHSQNPAGRRALELSLEAIKTRIQKKEG